MNRMKCLCQNRNKGSRINVLIFGFSKGHKQFENYTSKKRRKKVISECHQMVMYINGACRKEDKIKLKTETDFILMIYCLVNIYFAEEDVANILFDFNDFNCVNGNVKFIRFWSVYF